MGQRSPSKIPILRLHPGLLFDILSHVQYLFITGIVLVKIIDDIICCDRLFCLFLGNLH